MMTRLTLCQELFFRELTTFLSRFGFLSKGAWFYQL